MAKQLALKEGLLVSAVDHILENVHLQGGVDIVPSLVALSDRCESMSTVFWAEVF